MVNNIKVVDDTKMKGNTKVVDNTKVVEGTHQAGNTLPQGAARLHDGQRPISQEYQIYLPAIDTLVTGMVLTSEVNDLRSYRDKQAKKAQLEIMAPRFPV